MKCRAEQSRLSGELNCPANKSYTHRAVFLAALSERNSVIKNILYSSDTNATIEACKAFGAEIKVDKTTLIIANPINFKKSNTVNADNSGTTIRIATAIAALSDQPIMLTGDESLKKRPMQPILDALDTLGARCTSNNGKPPISIQGKIIGGKVSIPGNISSQFISALLICAPLTEKGIILNIENELVSKPYLDATITSMQEFGIKIDTIEKYKKYSIKPQKYNKTEFTVPSDYSSLALLLAAGVMVGEKISIKISKSNLPQGDKLFLKFLKKLGVTLKIQDESIGIEKIEELEGGRFDLSNTPDLLPPLAILALKCKKPLNIINVKHARYKETDRIAIISREMEKIGMSVNEQEDSLTLTKGKEISASEMNCEKDHRLFMAFCIVAMYVGNCSVTHPECVSVSYPEFISEMKKIGAKLEITAV